MGGGTPADSAKGLSSEGLADLLLTVGHLIYGSQETNCEMFGEWVIDDSSRWGSGIQESLIWRIMGSDFLLEQLLLLLR